MAFDITIKDEPDALVASIRQQVDLAEVGDRIPDAFRRLWSCVEKEGYGQGMPGIVNHRMEGRVADLEVFMPVASSFVPPDGITVRTLSGGRVATTMHTGPYDRVGPAYAAVAEWITEHGHHIVGPPRERYLNDPQVVGMDKAETEVEFPIEPA